MPKSDALGLPEPVRKGEVAPAELVEAAIIRIDKLNPTLNAVVHKLYDIGRKAAQTVDRNAPFAGVPFLMKDAVFPCDSACGFRQQLRHDPSILLAEPFGGCRHRTMSRRQDARPEWNGGRERNGPQCRPPAQGEDIALDDPCDAAMSGGRAECRRGTDLDRGRKGLLRAIERGGDPLADRRLRGKGDEGLIAQVAWPDAFCRSKGMAARYHNAHRRLAEVFGLQ